LRGKKSILGRKNDIHKIIKIYNFYKSALNRRKAKKKLTPNIIEIEGFMFVLINGLYHKVTKKKYTIKEIHEWSKYRKTVNDNIRKHHETRKKEKKVDQTEKEKRISQIYNQAIKAYPEPLRLLIGN